MSVVSVKSGSVVEIPRCSGVGLSSEKQPRRKKGMPSLPRDENTQGYWWNGRIFKTPHYCSPPTFILLTWVPTPHQVVKWSRHLFPTAYLRRRRMLIKTMGSPKQGTLGSGFYRNSVLLSPFNTSFCLLTNSIPGDVDGSDLSCQCSFLSPAKAVWCMPDNSHWLLCQDSSENFASLIPACPYIYPFRLSLIVRQNRPVGQLATPTLDYRCLRGTSSRTPRDTENNRC